ncbi:dephospho-CoA kinase [Thalassotalea sediminis]|uniref:dephospho-CoA kinase n=1 Tax=Thalassotalea sediminis TaxID=1759089 RepID=UPI0025731324|nr:dephospho-CoA kinase [Thalassotalea sediminis]
MSAFVIGLTGGIGSGKTTVSNQLANYGIEVVDADVIARDVVAKDTIGLKRISEHFGSSILTQSGELNRQALRNIVFNNEEEKQWLNNLLHPLIRENILVKLKQANSPYVILSAPLLFENNLQRYTNRNLLIDIEEPLQIARSIKRDNSNEREIRAIIASQMPRTQKQALADDIINNSNLTFDELANKVGAIHNQYLALAKN